jgi:hypothetical protein
MKKTDIFPACCGVAILIAAGLAGCGTGGAPRDLMSEEANARQGGGERPVAMRGEGDFLNGKLAAFVTVSRGFDRGPQGAGGRGGRGNRGGRGEEEGGRRRGGDGISDVYPVSFGDSEEEQKEAMEEYIRQAKARRAAGSPMPPVTLRVNLENRGTEPIEVEVTEVNSDLGNFAVRPPKLTIAPGEKGTLEPMVSQLGVTSDEIPLKLAIRVGNKKETQVVTVKNVILPSLRK